MGDRGGVLARRAQLATASADETVRLWDAGCGAAVLQLGFFGSPVTALAWDERGLAVGTGAGELVLLAVIGRDGPP